MGFSRLVVGVAVVLILLAPNVLGQSHATITVTPETTWLEVKPPRQASLRLRAESTLQCPLLTDPEPVDISMTPGERVDKSTNRVVWKAMRTSWTLDWHSGPAPGEFRLDHDFTLVLDGVDVPSHNFTDAITWAGDRQWANSIQCAREYGWSVTGAPVSVFVAGSPEAVGAQAAHPGEPAGIWGEAQQEDPQKGRSETPVEARVTFGAAIALVIVGLAVLITATARGRR